MQVKIINSLLVFSSSRSPVFIDCRNARTLRFH